MVEKNGSQQESRGGGVDGTLDEAVAYFDFFMLGLKGKPTPAGDGLDPGAPGLVWGTLGATSSVTEGFLGVVG